MDAQSKKVRDILMNKSLKEDINSVLEEINFKSAEEEQVVRQTLTGSMSVAVSYHQHLSTRTISRIMNRFYKSACRTKYIRKVLS